MRSLSTVLFAGCLAFAPAAALAQKTATPIRHVIVLFQENISFDHYFATYPHAENPPGEPRFVAAPGTPTVNGLTAALLTHNPNAANPFRLDRSQAATCDMDHGYTAEQKAFDGGLMDKFVEYTSARGAGCIPNGAMGYYDGNTVTALWNYAQHFAMNDNSFGTQFGPSTPGALDLVAGTTRGATVSDPDPAHDDCSKGTLLAIKGRNIGDLLNAKAVTWGWFQGGFRPTARQDGKAVCGARSVNITGASVADYVPHHEPFQYYAQTANPHHLPPSSPAMVGQTDQANHQYDLADFYAALEDGHLPAVSFVKAKSFQNGHPGFDDSNPLDEQTHLVTLINRVERSRYWKNTAIVIAYDDSDGWYDHVLPPILNGSEVAELDALNGPGRCGRQAQGASPGRCGYGPRLPLLVISPYARVNFVDHTLTDQSSIIHFIEDNWSLGRLGDPSMDGLSGPLLGMFDFAHPHAKALLLDPKTGEPPGR